MGVVGLAASGCGDAVATRQVQSSPSGNPLAKDNSLTGADGGDTPDLCLGYAGRILDCGGGNGYGDYDLADYVSDCELQLAGARGLSSGCGEALADLFACIADQDCESFACSSEEEAANSACPQGGRGGTTG